jgi:ACR3 family arsenite efflux pump ArsB
LDKKVKPIASRRLLRIAARIALPVAAASSVYLMLRVGHRNPSRLLLALFTGWVLTPFFALAWCEAMSKRWSDPAQASLHGVILLLAVCSALIYGYVAFGPGLAKPAFPFLVTPFVSLILIALFAVLGTRKK